MTTAGAVPTQRNEVQGTALRLAGLEADNLLAFLALLGLLRALEAIKPEWRSRIAWLGQPMRAHLFLSVVCDEETVSLSVEHGVQHLAKDYHFDRPNIAFSRQEFRLLARAARDDLERARIISALASDGATRLRSDSVEASALCALFGQGHQHFLLRLADLVGRDHPNNVAQIRKALFEPWQYDDELGAGLRWDPVEDRKYAYQYGDPSERANKVGTVTGANRLAAIGFGALASVPTSGGLRTMAVFGDRRTREICWPLSNVPLTLSSYLAVLRHPFLGMPELAGSLSAYGIRAIARARRFQSGNFISFSRAAIQELVTSSGTQTY